MHTSILGFGIFPGGSITTIGDLLLAFGVLVAMPSLVQPIPMQLLLKSQRDIPNEGDLQYTQTHTPLVETPLSVKLFFVVCKKS